MPIRRRTQIPGLPPGAVKEITAIQDEIAQELAVLRQEAVGGTTDTKQVATYAARYNEFIRVSPIAAGIDILFPIADQKTANRWIWILKIGGGNVRVRGVGGRVQGSTATQTLTSNGLYIFQSDGSDSWWSTVAGGGGGLTPPVAFTDLANMQANSVLVNNTASPATPVDMAVPTNNFVGRLAGVVVPITGAQATAILSTFTAGAQGVVGASGGGTTNFLRADGTWAAPGGGGLTQDQILNRIAFRA